jgi:hypothetical protein
LVELVLNQERNKHITILQVVLHHLLPCLQVLNQNQYNKELRNLQVVLLQFLFLVVIIKVLLLLQVLAKQQQSITEWIMDLSQVLMNQMTK